MAQKFKTTSQHIALDDSVEYSETDLKQAFESFIQEQPKQNSKAFFNFRTIFGGSMIFIALLYIIDMLMPGTIVTDSEFIKALPVISGFIITFIGLGWTSRKKKKKSKKVETKPSFLNEPITTSKMSGSAYSSTSETKNKTSNTNKTSSNSFESMYYDQYALKKTKKLFKSARDKKISGVCGGLAKYLGVSSTFLRLVFVVATFMGWGSPILIYFILSIVLSKEPQPLID